MKTKIKNFFQTISNFIYDFRIKKLGPFFQKIGYFLTHNFVLRKEENQLIFFRLIKIKITNRRREGLVGYLFIMLWLVGFLIFTAYPLIYSLYLSFQKAFFNIQTGITGTSVGFANFKNVLSDATLLPLFANYLGTMVFAVPIIIVFAILIAVLINQPIKGKGIFRTIFFLPVVISTGPVLGELILQDATSLPSISESTATMTIMNNLPTFVAEPLLILFDSLLLTLWYAGIPILVFLAGLQKINKEIYEAAAVDGASPWDTFWKITLPSIKPLISVNIIYVVVSMSLYVEAGGILDLAKTHMLSGTPDNLFWKGYGYAAAIAWIYFLMMVLVMLLFIGLVSIRRRRRSR